MIENATAAALRDHVSAFNARDLDGLMAGFTDDAVWISGTTVVRGRAELAEFFGKAMEALMATLSISSLLAERDRAACQLTETLNVDGVERSYAIAGFYELRDGRISSAKIYREGSAEVKVSMRP